MTDHLIHRDAPLREAFIKLNNLSGRNMTLFVVDDSGRLYGSLTDGDLRRAIIEGLTLEVPVARACRRDCMSVRADESLIPAVAEARSRRIALLPVINPDGKIVELLDLTVLKTILPLDAVLMAGGRGERLRPLTLDCPKPLLNVGGKPIIDYNIDELRANGVDNIFVTVNYLKEQIIDHFRAPAYMGKVRCISEPRRLGTMGSLSLIPREEFRHDDILVMNSDLLTSIDFARFYLHHAKSGATLTIAATPYTVSVPFAILRTEGSRVTGLTEKPTYNYFANAGVYIMRREVLDMIPHAEYLDAPDLIERLIARGDRVEFYPIEGSWIDIGSPDDYRYANELMSRPKR
ncbi:MAG: nucleotidyltransferase family protein [Muribaculaceae bacterium]|nr:nucleotidyltransferase family protein [Muribaculaceae bacterium]